MSTVSRPPRGKRPNRKPEVTSVVETRPVVADENSVAHDNHVGHHVHHEDDHPASMQHKIVMLVAVVAPFLGFVAAIYLAFQYGWVSPFYVTMMVVGWFLTGIGITIGFHRMLTHRSFDTYDGVRLFWAGLGSLAIEGPPLAWCAVHRKHHQHSDHEGDPHSPHLHGDGWKGAIMGFWHAHTGWLFNRSWDRELIEKYVPDLMKVKGMEAISRNYVWWVVASLFLPAVIGGLVTMSWFGAFLGFLWGGLARIFLTHHVTWSINSICHIFGSRDFHSDDDSRNNAIFGILSHGEGWHNNHHAFPTSARHGLKWWQFDSSWLIIKAMSMVGLVWNIRTPSEKAMAAKKRG